jgi:hypothetical protein
MTKRYNFCLVLLSLLLSLLAAQKLNAQQIDMSGTVGYDRYGGTVTLSASRIQNYASQGSLSGTLVLQLWATSMPYYGQGVLNGYKLAEANLGTLWGGYYLSNINRTVAFFEPPRGYYNTVLVLGEWNGYQYLTVDWCNLIGIKNFGGMPAYTPVPAPPALDLIDEYVGTWEGSQTLQFNGTSYETTATSTISRYQNAGLYSKAYVRTPGQLIGEAETWQYDNGTMYGVVKSQGSEVIATVTGTWYISGRSIISNVSVVAGNTSYTQYINHSFPDSETMISSSSTSTGGSISGTAKKVLIPPTPTVAPPSAPNGGGAPAQVQKPKKGGKSSSAKKSSGGSTKSSAKKSNGGSSKKSSASKSSGGKKSTGKKKAKK